MARLRDVLLLASIPAAISLHLYLAPYTKVEESFNIQAVHDILRYGIPYWNNATENFRAEYDHFTFPGAVPRTFVGALVLAGVVRPFIWLNAAIDRQAFARGILGVFNGLVLTGYAKSVQRAFGKATGTWYIIFQVTQFHVIYYASRTLPNMFAFGISTLAFTYLLSDPAVIDQQAYTRSRCCLALYLLTIAGVIFRSEIAVLLGTTTLYLWLQGQTRLKQEIIPAGATGLLIGLTITVSVDSFFWQQIPLWPELSGFLYNVLSGKATDWGTQPWYFYFTNSLPRLLLNPLTYTVGIPLACLIPSQRHAAKSLVIPSLTYIALYSFLPHKEWRFIIYAIPPLTATAALGASYAWTHRTKSLIYRLISLAFVLSTLASFCLSTFILLPASALNYPGAQALNTLHEYADGSQSTISVHMDTLACQTGVTRFLERPTPKTTLSTMPGSPDGSLPEFRTGMSEWVYDKTEDEETKNSEHFWDRFDYAIIESEDRLGESASGWELIESVNGFSGMRVLRPGEKGQDSQVEKGIVRMVLGDVGVRAFESVKDLTRKYVTRGWWVEMTTVQRLKIMKHVR